MYIDLKSDQVNLSYISHYIKQQCGEDYTIVTNEGVELEDSSVTQSKPINLLNIASCHSSAGLGFWKTPSRKLYAVPSKTDSDSEEDFLMPVRKKKCSEKDNMSKTLLESMSSIQTTVDSIMSVTKTSRISVGLKKAMNDCLKCNICNGPIKPPVIVMKCCKTLLGCESCVNAWFSGADALTKTCPKCRSPRGYNETVILRGLDPLLDINIQKLMMAKLLFISLTDHLL